MSQHNWLAGLAGLILLLSTALAVSADEMAADSGYLVQPGDRLLVSVWKEEDLEAMVLIRPDGVFSFPLAGDIVTSNKTIEQIRDELTEKLEKFIPDLVVTVMAQEIAGNRIYVIGQVNRPGPFIASSRMDVMQALSVAGGTTPFAALNSIKILRRAHGTSTTLPFRYSEVVKGDNLEQNIVLRAGDVVVVP